MIRTLLVSIGLAVSTIAAAKGAHRSVPMEPASGAAQADSTPAAQNDRTTSGSGLDSPRSVANSSANGMVGSSGGGGKIDDPMSFGGVGKQEAATAAGGPCVYKGVMTDAEIATCRAASAADAKRSAHRRRK